MDEKNIITNNAILKLLIEEEERNSVREDMGVVKNGDDIETHAEKLFVQDDVITLRESKDTGLESEYAGILAKNYDGLHDGLLVLGADGNARVGDKDYLKILATRENNPTDKGIAVYDAASGMFKTINEIVVNNTGVGIGNNHIPTEALDVEGNIKGKHGYFEKFYSKRKDDSATLDLEINIEPGIIWMNNKSDEIYYRNMLRCMRGAYSSGKAVADDAWIFSNEIGINDSNGWRDWVTPMVKAIGKTEKNKWEYSINAGGYNGSPVLSITNRSGNNRVGILNNDPSEALEVNGNIKLGTNTTGADRKVIVNSGDTNKAGFEAYGKDQGTGYVYIGQSPSHGGGISYNGDLNPKHVDGEIADHITFYRRTNNQNHAVFQYAHGSNKVYFKDSLEVVNSVQAKYFYADGAKGFTVAPTNGRGIRFWDSDSYKIYMSHSNDEAWGGKIGSVAEYNMYFRMHGSANRGFVFAGSNGAATQITTDGTIYTKKYLEGSSPFVSGFTGIGTTRLDLASSRLTVDNLTVRQTMNVYELVVNQVRGSNGSLAITNSAKIYSVKHEGNLTYTCKIDQGKDNKLYQPFRKGDFVYSQTFTGKNIKYWVGIIDSVKDDSFKVKLKDGLVVFNNPTDYPLPVNTNYEGGKKYDLAGISGNVTLKIEGYDFEGGARVAKKVNGNEEVLIGTMTAADNAVHTFSFNIELQGNTEISIYSINADGGTIKDVKVLTRNTIDIPTAGDVVHQRGSENDPNRQGFMYLTNSDQGAPYIDVSDGIKTATPQHNTRIRIGKLSGISANSGYGIWASTDGKNEGFAISSDGYARIAGWSFDEGALEKTFNSLRLNIGKSAWFNGWHGFEMGKDAENRINMLAHENGNNYEFQIKRNREQVFYASQDKALIAGWNFDNSRIFGDVNRASSNATNGAYIAISNTSDANGNSYYTGRKLEGLALYWHKPSNAGTLVFGQMLSNGSNLKPNYYGVQMMSHTGKEYFALGADTNHSGSESVYARIAGWNFNDTTLSKTIGSKGLIKIGHLPINGQYGFSVGTNDGNDDQNIIKMFMTNGNAGYLQGRKNGSTIFDLRTDGICSIAGWNFDDTALWTGKKQSENNFTKIGLTIHKDGAIRSKNFRIDTNGNAFFNGTVESEGGKIGGFKISKYHLQTANYDTFNSSKRMRISSSEGAITIADSKNQYTVIDDNGIICRGSGNDKLLGNVYDGFGNNQIYAITGMLIDFNISQSREYPDYGGPVIYEDLKYTTGLYITAKNTSSNPCPSYAIWTNGSVRVDGLIQGGGWSTSWLSTSSSSPTKLETKYSSVYNTATSSKRYIELPNIIDVADGTVIHIGSLSNASDLAIVGTKEAPIRTKGASVTDNGGYHTATTNSNHWTSWIMLHGAWNKFNSYDSN